MGSAKIPPALKSDSNQTGGLVPLVGDENGEDEGKSFWGSVQSDCARGEEGKISRWNPIL